MSSEHPYGIYGEKWDAYVDRLSEAGRLSTISSSSHNFHNTNCEAIESAKRAWDEGLPVVTIALWAYEGPSLSGLLGRQGLMYEWSLVLSSIVDLGWECRGWHVEMDSGHDYTAHGLFLRGG